MHIKKKVHTGFCSLKFIWINSKEMQNNGRKSDYANYFE